jgi:hypothetical protein
MKFRALTSILIAATMAACGDAQVDADYAGEPLATVEGTITTSSGASKGPHEATLVWLNDGPGPSVVIATKAPVKGNFPASFRLKVFTPPPANALVDYTLGGMYPNEVRLGLGYITTVKAGVTEPQLEDPDGGITGLAENFLIIYAENDVKPGSHVAELLHGTPKKGFHLMKVVQPCFSLKGEACNRTCDLPGAAADCFEQCQATTEATCTAECANDPGTDPERVAYCNRGKDKLFEAKQKLKTKIEIRLDDPENLSFPDWQ